MGDRYYLQLACAWCGAMNPETRDDLMEEGIYYAPSSGFMDFTCRKCKQRNWITQIHGAIKIKDEKELEERYKQNGFELLK